MEQLTLEPICEIVTGAVLFQLKCKSGEMYVVSKSGGFCNVDVFSEIFERVIHNNRNIATE